MGAVRADVKQTKSAAGSGAGKDRATKRAMLTSALDDGHDASSALKTDSGWLISSKFSLAGRPSRPRASAFPFSHWNKPALVQGANWPPVKRARSVHLHGSLAGGTHFSRLGRSGARARARSLKLAFNSIRTSSASTRAYKSPCCLVTSRPSEPLALLEEDRLQESNANGTHFRICSACPLGRHHFSAATKGTKSGLCLLFSSRITLDHRRPLVLQVNPLLAPR